ncbi:hypothetical protein [Kribbella antibiotica]|uniref:hypothetical protein n=1 Tax=Kribbella antibiotica TaxID=190195 RepID=UPI001404CE79|nr:hypothetical protein [Kribbella antibiotica]
MTKSPDKRSWFTSAFEWVRADRWRQHRGAAKTLAQVTLAQVVAWLMRRWLG